MELNSIISKCGIMAMGLDAIIDHYKTSDLKEIFNQKFTDLDGISSDVKRIFHNLTIQELEEAEIPLSRWQWTILHLPSVFNFSLFAFFYQKLTFQLTAAVVNKYIAKEFELRMSSEFAEPELQIREQVGAKEKVEGPSIEELNTRREEELKKELYTVRSKLDAVQSKLNQKEKELQDLEADIQNVKIDIQRNETKEKLKVDQKTEILILRSQKNAVCQSTYKHLWENLSFFTKKFRKLKKIKIPEIADVDFLLTPEFRKPLSEDPIYLKWIRFKQDISESNESQLNNDILLLQKEKKVLKKREQVKQLKLQQCQAGLQQCRVELQQYQEQEKKILDELAALKTDRLPEILLSPAMAPRIQPPERLPEVSTERASIEEEEKKAKSFENRVADGSIYESLAEPERDDYGRALHPLLVMATKFLKTDITKWEKSFREIGRLWRATTKEDPQFSSLMDKAYGGIVEIYQFSRVMHLKSLKSNAPEGVSLRALMEQIQQSPPLEWNIGISDLNEAIGLSKYNSLEKIKKWLADKVTVTGKPLSDQMSWAVITMLRNVGMGVQMLQEKPSWRPWVRKIPTRAISRLSLVINPIISKYCSIMSEEQLFSKTDSFKEYSSRFSVKSRKKFDNARVKFLNSIQSKLISQVCERNLHLCRQIQGPITNEAIYKGDHQDQAIVKLCQTSFAVLQQFSKEALADPSYIGLLELWLS